MTSAVRQLAEQSAQGTRGSGAWRRGICLACPTRTGKPDRRGCFSFNHLTGWYTCFKCGLGGRVKGFENVEYQAPDAPKLEHFEAPEDFLELCRGEGRTSMSLEPAREFLRKRGLKDEALWKEARIGACLDGRFKGRVVVPILSPEGVWKGYVGRSWHKKPDVPYLYPAGMNRRELLYNHAALLKQTETPVYVVEGVLDVLALWPDAVALLGKPSDAQVYSLAEASRPVVVCLDGDAWEEGEALTMRLQLEGQRAGNVRLPPKTDPDEVERAWLDAEAQRSLA